jgi:hypothetical protein
MIVPTKTITVTYTFSIPARGIDSGTVHSEAVDPATAIFQKFVNELSAGGGAPASSLKMTMTPDGFSNGGISIM